MGPVMNDEQMIMMIMLSYSKSVKNHGYAYGLKYCADVDGLMNEYFSLLHTYIHIYKYIHKKREKRTKCGSYIFAG